MRGSTTYLETRACPRPTDRTSENARLASRARLTPPRRARGGRAPCSTRGRRAGAWPGRPAMGSAAAGSSARRRRRPDAKGGSTPAGSSGSAAGGGGGAAGAASTAAASTRDALDREVRGLDGRRRRRRLDARLRLRGLLRGGPRLARRRGARLRRRRLPRRRLFELRRRRLRGAGLRFGGACAGGAAGAGGGRTRGRGAARPAAAARFGLALRRCVAAAREARIFAAFASLRSAAAARAWAAAAKGSVVAAGPEDIVLCVSKPSTGSPCIVDGQHCGSPSTFGTVGQRFCAAEF